MIDHVDYRGYHVVELRQGFMILDGWDYIQVPPFRHVETACKYIDQRLPAKKPTTKRSR
jgi:hypothetical protein